MEYRNVERAGLKISALSFGCMRFHDEASAVEAVRKAIELGVNYFDVAPLYGHGAAEIYLGRALKGLRDEVIVTAKCSPGNGDMAVGSFDPAWGFGITTADEVRWMIEKSMKFIGVDHLDVYHLWSVHSELVFDEAMKPGGFLEGVQKAKADGLFDHIGFTSHMNSESLIRCMDMFDFEMLTIPFHLLDPSRAMAVEYCRERGIAVFAMNPLAGGRLARKSPVTEKIAADLGFSSMTEAALRFLNGYPGITAALAGITYASQVVEDAEDIAKGPIVGNVADLLVARLKEVYSNVDHLCTTCGYCGECPEGILIPNVLTAYTNLLVPSMAESAREELAKKLGVDGPGYDPSRCTACKTCQSKCPNELPISDLMSRAAALFRTS